jgi:hypothetical protein
VQRRSRFCLVFIVVCSALLAACASKTPAERVAESRSAYKATLNSFFVKETPVEAEMAATPGEGEESAEMAAGSEAEAAGEGVDAEGEMPVAVEVRKDAVLDVIVQHQTNDPLPGITLDISMVDGAQNEVAHWQYWVDTAGLPKANQRPYSIVFEDIAYQEGYGFNVEVRQPVPESERGAYREFEGL